MRECHCVVFCPWCKNILNDGRPTGTDTDLVRYCCANCGTHSEWSFDAPVPLLRRFHRKEQP